MRSTCITLGSILLFACAGGRDEHKSESAVEADQSALATCTAGMVRARDCTDRYIPALVDLRVRLDVPAGIVKIDEEKGRPALVQMAMDEWAEDSKDPNIAATCEKMASQPAERLQGFLEGANGCLQSESCDAYVECVMPLHEAMFAKR
jgi:hypothetical protein